MAGDWIKMRTDLYRDPKVCAIADHLMHQDGELASFVNQNCQRKMTVTRNVMRNVTVGALVSVWGVMRLRGKRIDDDLVFKSGTLWIIDDVAELPGFGQAMASVGWVEADQEGLVFRNFFSEYNVDPNEDAKAKNAERQRRYREKSKQDRNVTECVTATSQSNAREEKRREEISITSVIDKEGAKAPKPAKRATQIPANFYPNETGVGYAEERRVNLAVEMESFRNYHQAKGSTFKDWQAAWRTWCDKAVEFGRTVSTAPKQALSFAERDEQARRRRWEEMTGRKWPESYDPTTIDMTTTRPAPLELEQ